MKRLIPLVLIFLAAACKKDDVDGDVRYAHFKYAQTQCADPWPSGATDVTTVLNAKRYLDSMNATAVTLKLSTDGTAEVCNACSCKTGKVFHATTTEDKAAKFLAIGFVRE